MKELQELITQLKAFEGVKYIERKGVLESLEKAYKQLKKELK